MNGKIELLLSGGYLDPESGAPVEVATRSVEICRSLAESNASWWISWK
jgi:hypothetical protein